MSAMISIPTESFYFPFVRFVSVLSCAIIIIVFVWVRGCECLFDEMERSSITSIVTRKERYRYLFSVYFRVCVKFCVCASRPNAISIRNYPHLTPPHHQFEVEWEVKTKRITENRQKPLSSSMLENSNNRFQWSGKGRARVCDGGSLGRER